MAQSDLSVKDRRGAIGASSSRSRLGDSHSETPSEVRKITYLGSERGMDKVEGPQVFLKPEHG